MKIEQLDENLIEISRKTPKILLKKKELKTKVIEQKKYSN